jgi:hypothetical protein
MLGLVPLLLWPAQPGKVWLRVLYVLGCMLMVLWCWQLRSALLLLCCWGLLL